MIQTLDFVVRHGYAVLFWGILAEQGGLPLPSTPLLLACGALAKDGRVRVPWIVLTGVAACLIADNVWFLVGRLRGAKVLRLICRVALEPDSCVRQTETVYMRYGIRSLLVAKFVPGLNAVSAPLAAISGVSHTRFVAYDAAGSLIWVGSITGLGYIFSGQLDKIWNFAARTGSWLALLLIGLLAAWIVWKFWQRQRFLKKLAVSRIAPQELRDMLEGGEEIVVVDVRNALESEMDSVPGALRIPLEDLETRHNEIPRDRDIVLFCS